MLTIVRNTSYAWLAGNRPAALVLAGDPTTAQARLDQADPDPTPARLIARAEAETVRQAQRCRRRTRGSGSARDPRAQLQGDRRYGGVPIGTVMSADRSGPAPDAGDLGEPSMLCPIGDSPARPMSMAELSPIALQF